jgi:HEPN domain-containing protein
MPPEKFPKGSPQDWLLHAYSDLELARTAKSPRVLYETLCYHAQQAAEKALKALLVAHGTPAKRTHNIGMLLSLLPEDVVRPPEVEEAVSLTEYAVSTRYPGDLEPISEEEYQEAMRLAECVVRWAEEIISKQ